MWVYCYRLQAEHFGLVAGCNVPAIDEIQIAVQAIKLQSLRPMLIVYQKTETFVAIIKCQTASWCVEMTGIMWMVFHLDINELGCVRWRVGLCDS